MDRLYPTPARIGDVRTAAAGQRSPVGDRPWVMLNMAASIDGAAAIDGLSGGLSGRADKALFTAMRAEADIILVGARTANAERYRRARTAAARVAVVSATLSIDTDLPLFSPAPPETESPETGATHRASAHDPDNAESPETGATHRASAHDPDNPESPETGAAESGATASTATARLPLVVTTADAAGAAVSRLEGRAELLRAGRGTVDLRVALRQLGALGARVVLCEGGPTLNAALLAEDLVDEMNVTLAPLAVGTAAPRIVSPPAAEPLEPPAPTTAPPATAPAAAAPPATTPPAATPPATAPAATMPAVSMSVAAAAPGLALPWISPPTGDPEASPARDAPPRGFALSQVLTAEGSLFVRWVRCRQPASR